MTSLRARLNLGVLALSVLFFLGLVLAEGFFIRQVAHYYVGTRLQHDTEILLGAIQQPMQDSLTDDISLQKERIHPIYRRPLSGHYYKIGMQSQAMDDWLRSRSLWDEDFAIAEPLPPLPALVQTQGPGKQPLLVYIDQFEWRGRTITIAVAESLAELQPLIRQAQWWSAGVGGIVVFVLWWLFGRWLNLALAPLNELSEQVAQLKQGVREQLMLQYPVRELQPVVAEVNALVQALDERIARSRNAMGNLAHALKTPLAMLRQLGSAHEASSEQWWQELDKNVTLIQNRIDSELKRARIAGQQGARRYINVRDETLDLLDTLERIHADTSRQLQVEIAPDLVLKADRQDFLELIGNLIDNAFKYATKQIRVSAHSQDDSGLVLAVEDDGPGCDPDDLNQIVQRGRRLDESGSGHGLGLSIVQDIVAQYGAACEFGRSSLGGLRVTLRWPSPINENQ